MKLEGSKQGAEQNRAEEPDCEAGKGQWRLKQMDRWESSGGIPNRRS